MAALLVACSAAAPVPTADVPGAASADAVGGLADGVARGSDADAASAPLDAAGDTGAAGDAASTNGAPDATGEASDPGGPLDGTADAQADAAPEAGDTGAAPEAGDTGAAPEAGDTGAAAAPDTEKDDSGTLPVIETPVAATVGPPVATSAEVLVPGPIGFAWPMQGETVLAETGTQTVLAAKQDIPPEQVGGNVGGVRAAIRIASGDWLFGTDAGLYAIVSKKWKVSPLQALLPGPPLALARVSAQPIDALWLGCAGSLWVHDGKLLHSVDLAGLEPALPLLAGGPAVLVAANGVPGTAPKPTSWVPALWLYSGSALHAVLTKGASATAWLEKAGLPTTQLVADGEQTLWLPVAGKLRRRDADGSWQWLSLPADVTAVAVRDTRPEAVVTTKDGLWLHEAGVFFPLQGTQGLHAIALDDQGRVLAKGKAGLVRLSLGDAKPPPPPTWTTDIEPLLKARCADCHVLGKPKIKLDSAAAWQNWIGAINYQLEKDYMPLPDPKLTPQQKAMIKAWQKGGFVP
ncbi:MAG: hypothetical protein EXR79_00810 [Myxococcales bacterium]|nr:hypothetical protein [Myxococcales bacterium]